MLFWTLAAAIGLTVALLVSLALVRHRGAEEPAAAYDLRVYRDQLREIDRDLGRGIIGAEDADRMRTEVSRRVLEADRALSRADAGAEDPRPARLGAVIGTVVLIAGALWLYQRIGAAGYPDLPISDRIALAEQARADRPDQASAVAAVRASAGPAPEVDPAFAQLMDRLRAVVAERPNDIQGLELLARNEASVGNPAAGAEAQRRLIAVKGNAATADDYAALADLMVMAAGGVVTAEAEEVLAATLARNPDDGTALFYAGLMQAQTLRPDLAFHTWKRLLDGSDPAAPWVPIVVGQMPELAAFAGEDYTLPAHLAGGGGAPFANPPFASLPGPTSDDVAAAGDMTAEDRNAMIRGMVEQLNNRLASQGGSAEEWARLIGALGVLGETDRARTIWTEAQGVFAGHPADLATVRAAADRAGVAE